MSPTPSDVTIAAVTSGMTPHGTSPEDSPQGLVVTAVYGTGGRSIRRRGQVLISPGVVCFSPFQTTDGAVEVTEAVASITMTRGWAPWTGDRFQLGAPARVHITVPRRRRRRMRRLLSAAGIRVHD